MWRVNATRQASLNGHRRQENIMHMPPRFPSHFPATRFVRWAAALGAAASLGACVIAPLPGPGGVGPEQGGPVVVAPMAPPPPPAEVIVAAPGPGYLWIGGYWGWAGGRHVWTPGRWTQPRPGYRWVPRGWNQGPGGWHQHGGYWAR
jgi:WXXGXW repeat (2 copies)